MQHVADIMAANVTALRGAPAATAIEVASLNHIYQGRDGEVPAL